MQIIEIFQDFLLQPFSYDFNILELLQNEQDDLQTNRAAYEVMDDGKVDELYDI